MAIRCLLHELEGYIDGVTSVALTPDGLQAVSASSDKTLIVWDLQKGRAMTSFDADESLRTCVITSDGRTIVAGGVSGRVHILRLEGVGS